MELSLNSKCEELRHENTKIENENKKLTAWIETKEKGRVHGELQRLSEIKQHHGRAINAGYGENSQTLQKWESRCSERCIPTSSETQFNEISNHDSTKEKAPTQPHQKDTIYHNEMEQLGPQLPRGDSLHQPQDPRIPQPVPRHIPTFRQPEVAAASNLVNDTKLTPQGIQEIVQERDAYRERVIKLERDVKNMCHERAVLEQKYQIKLEVCERLQEDNQRLSSIIPQASQRATLATDDDVEVLKETCRVYQEDFQAERTQRVAAHAEKDRLKAELERSKLEIKDLNEKVTFLMSILQHQQPPSPLRRPSCPPWDFNETYRTNPLSGYVPQRRRTFNSSPTHQSGDVIRRGLHDNRKTADLCPDLYAIVDDLDVKDGDAMYRYRGRRKSMSL